MPNPIDLDAVIDGLAEKYRAGASLEDLALECGHSAPVVGRRLAAAGVEIRRPGGVKGKPRPSYRYE